MLFHLYLFYKLYAAFGKKKWLAAIGVFFILILMTWFFRRSFPGTVFQVWGVPVLYTWLGFLFISMPWLLLSDICRLFSLLMDKFTGKNWARFTAPRRLVPAVLIFCFCLALYAFWSAAHPRVRFVDFPTEKLPEDIERLRIVQLSDVHLSSLIRAPFLAKVLGHVAKLHPDFLVITGDLVDSDMRDRHQEAMLLRNTRGKYGNFAITGNHEEIVGLKQSLEFMEKAQLHVLQGERIEVAGIELIGIDDPLVRSRAGTEKTPELHELIQDKAPDKFRLVLAHRPKIPQESIGLFDLQLSGHTHNGQIWPGNLIVQYLFKEPAPGLSHYHGENGSSALYLNPGTGFWGPPMRLWAQPEITVIDLIRP